MKFDKILEYQTVDKELIALEREDAKSPERAAYVSAISKVSAATDAVKKLFADSDEIISGYDKLAEKVDALESKLNEFNGIVEDIASVGETEYYLKQIDAIAADIAALEREVAAASSRADGTGANIGRTWEAGISLSEAKRQAEIAYAKFLNGFAPRAAEIKAQLDALAKEIPEEIMKEYLNIRNKKFPVLMKYDPKAGGSCAACGLGLPNDALGKLKAAGDYAECPYCHRILYIS